MKIFVHLVRDETDTGNEVVTVRGQTLDFVSRGNATVEVGNGDSLDVVTPAPANRLTTIRIYDPIGALTPSLPPPLQL